MRKGPGRNTANASRQDNSSLRKRATYDVRDAREEMEGGDGEDAVIEDSVNPVTYVVSKLLSFGSQNQGDLRLAKIDHVAPLLAGRRGETH